MEDCRLKEIFIKIVKKQNPDFYDFLHNYFERWMKRKDWLEHEIILKVLCRYFQKSNDKLDYLEKQIEVANSVLININEFKKRADRLYNQSYSQWEDWYAELRAIEYLKKEEGFNKFKCIKEGNNQTPEFEAWRNNDSALVEVKHKHFSDADKIFDDFYRKLCAESVRDEILRKSFGSNLQENPNEFKKLLESKNKWEIFIKGLKEKVKAHERRYTYSEQIKIDWLEDNGEYGLSDQLCKSPLPLPQRQNVVDRRRHQTEIQNKFYERIKAVANKAISQIEDYQKRVNYKFHIKYIICFVQLNIPVALFLKDEINKVSITKLKNKIESNHQNTILEIVI